MIEGSLFQTCCESVKRRVAKDIPWNCSQNNQVGFLFVVSNYSIFHISVNPERKTNPGKLCWGTEGLPIEFTISMRLIKQFSTCPCCYRLGSASGHSFLSPQENTPELCDSTTSQLLQVSKNPNYLTCTPYTKKSYYWQKLHILVLCAHIVTRLLKQFKNPTGWEVKYWEFKVLTE